jgi:hypothetical protein
MTKKTALEKNITLHRVKPKRGWHREKRFNICFDGKLIGWTQRYDAPKNWSVFIARPHKTLTSGNGNTFSEAFRWAIFTLILDLIQETDRMRTIAKESFGETISDPKD